MKRYYVTYAARRVGATCDFYAVGCSVGAMTEADARACAFVKLHVGGYETDHVLRINEEAPLGEVERRLAAGEPLHVIEEDLDRMDAVAKAT